MKQLRQFAALLAVALLFSACKKDWNELGSQLINEDDIIVLSFDSLAIKASIHKEDSLTSLNASSSLLGAMHDADFGATNASIYTEFRMPSSDVVFGEGALADSMILSLDLSGYYGDTTSLLHLTVVEMLEQIITTTTDSLGEDSTHTIYTNQDFETDVAVLGSLDLLAEPTSNSTVNIVLSEEFAQSFLDAEASNFVDNDAFQEFFNGLYIATDDVMNGGVLLKFDLLSENSKMALYYHNDEADSLSYDFQINSNADKMTRWSHDYSGTSIETSFEEENLNVAYVQGGVGIRAYLDLSTIETLKDSNYIVHQAELILPYIGTENDSIYGNPEKLGLAAVNSEGKLEVLNEDQNGQSSSYFDGSRDELTQTYTFNIARYVHSVIEEGYTSRLGLYVPSSIVQPERVMIDNYSSDSTGVRLKLLVTQQ